LLFVIHMVTTVTRLNARAPSPWKDPRRAKPSDTTSKRRAYYPARQKGGVDTREGGNGSFITKHVRGWIRPYRGEPWTPTVVHRVDSWGSPFCTNRLAVAHAGSCTAQRRHSVPAVRHEFLEQTPTNICNRRPRNYCRRFCLRQNRWFGSHGPANRASQKRKILTTIRIGQRRSVSEPRRSLITGRRRLRSLCHRLCSPPQPAQPRDESLSGERAPDGGDA